MSAVPVIDLTVQRAGQGVLWVNSSHKDGFYVREAEKSAQTVRKFVADADFVLISDQEHRSLDPVFNHQALGKFVVPECLAKKVHFNGQMIAKLSALKHMTWQKNLYLGSDIAALRPGIEGIFRLLDHFDIVVAHAPTRTYAITEHEPKLLEMPACFPEMNCDLVGYRRTAAVGEFLAAWEETYSTNAIDHPHDQGAFRYLLLKTDLRVYIVPPEYNYRGSEFRQDTVVLQRRSAIGQYAGTYPHIQAIYGPFPSPGLRGYWPRLKRRLRSYVGANAIGSTP